MVDYNAALPQLQQFQAPNVLALAQQANQMQLGNILMQEKQRGFAESNALRGLISQGVDLSTPEGQRKAIAAAPNAGPAFVKTNLEIQGQERANKTAMAELAIKHASTARSLLPNVNDQAAWSAWRSDLVSKLPGAAAVIPEQFSPAAKENAAMTAEQFIARNKPEIHTAGEQMYAVNPYAATGRPVTVAGAPAAAPAAAAPAAAPAAAGAPAGFDMARAKAASANIESGGKYDALGPVTKNGDRAYGKYQVMGANIPSWTKEALGKSMTPEEFLADPAAQEKVYEQQFGKNVAKYGNVADAASVWFTGKPLAQAGNVSDVLGTTAPQYVSKFMAGYGGAGDGGAAPRMMTAPQFAIPGSVPGYVQPMNALAAAAAAPANAFVATQQTPLSLAPSIPGAAPAGAAPGTPINISKPPEGYTRDAQGALKFIPGGPADPAVIAARQAATTTGTETARAQVTAQTSLPKIIDNAKILEEGISGLIGNTVIDAKGNVKYDKKAPPHPGFETAVGVSLSKALPQFMVPYEGTDRAGFEKRFEQIKGGAFLDAYNTLRGGGAITEKEGEKGTAALNRMSLATSEKEFVQAATEFRAIVQRGVQRAKEQAGKTGSTPAAQTGNFAITTPDNRVHTFPSQEALDNFKRAAGL